MKRIKHHIKIAFICTFGFYLFINGCVRDRGIRTSMSYDNLKAISLRELQKKIAQGSEQDLIDVKSFYGLTNIYGFLLDTSENDLILFGEADKEKEPLNFDDFVVSLKNAYCFYCKTEGNTIYYSDPSCTIDPDPGTMELLNKLNNSDSVGEPDERGKSWEEICAKPQSVGVFGIPFNSHLASLMVNADYMLKDITNGNIKIDLEGGFKSLHQIRKELVVESMNNNMNVNLGSPMNRFEFTAPEAYFRNSENFYLLYSLPVTLVTEEEYISKNTISGTGKSDSLAKEFADNFNMRYEEISKVHPTYESLLQSYRIFAIAKAIRESELIADTSFFSVIFNHYRIEEVNVPSALPGKSMLDFVTYKTDEGSYTHYMYSCGGVNLGSKVLKSPVKTMKEMEITNSIILARPGAGAVEWNAERVNAKIWVLNINRTDLLPNISTLTK
jgi:hypothetical protein